MLEPVELRLDVVKQSEIGFAWTKENTNVASVITGFKPYIFGIYSVVNLINIFFVKLKALITKQSTSHHLQLLSGKNNKCLLSDEILLLKDKKADLQVKENGCCSFLLRLHSTLNSMVGLTSLNSMMNLTLKKFIILNESLYIATLLLMCKIRLFLAFLNSSYL